MAFPLSKIVNAGWVGRDKASLMAHIKELEEEGIPAPKEVPICFPIPLDRITQDSAIEVIDESDHSGEVEYVLLFHRGSVYVTVGSDHTDRKIEVNGVPKAKVFYPNVVAKKAWRLGDVTKHWDELILRCRIHANNEKVLYQEAPLASIIGHEELIEFVKSKLVAPDNLDGLLVYSGTIAAKIRIQYSPVWDFELEDPVRKMKISHSYTCVPTGNWFNGE